MITDSFDIATETYINEEDFYGKQGKMVDTCIIIFSDQIYKPSEEYAVLIGRW